MNGIENGEDSFDSSPSLPTPTTTVESSVESTTSHPIVVTTSAKMTTDTVPSSEKQDFDAQINHSAASTSQQMVQPPMMSQPPQQIYPQQYQNQFLSTDPSGSSDKRPVPHPNAAGYRDNFYESNSPFLSNPILVNPLINLYHLSFNIYQQIGQSDS